MTERLPILRRAAHAAIVSLAIATSVSALPAAANAQPSSDQSVVFALRGQNLWGPSNPLGVTAAYGSPAFAQLASASAGTITGSEHADVTPPGCRIFGCGPIYADTRSGAQTTLETRGRLTFGASAQLTGTLDVDYRARARTEVLASQASFHPGDRVTLRSTVTAEPGSSLRATTSYQADASFGLDFGLGTSRTVCGLGNTPGCTAAGGELWSLARGSVDVVDGGAADGHGVAGAVTTFSPDPVASLPSFMADHPHAVRSVSPLFEVGFDPVQIAAALPGAPGCVLACSAFGVTYSLTTPSASMSVALDQLLRLDVDVQPVTYDFSVPARWRRAPYWASTMVVVPCSQAHPLGIPDPCAVSPAWGDLEYTLVDEPWRDAAASVTLQAGVKLEIEYPETNGAALQVTPRFAATATLLNQSKLRVTSALPAAGRLDAQTQDGALTFTYSPARLPGITEIAFFGQTFALDLGAQVGAALSLPFAPPGTASGFLPGTSPGPPPSERFVPLATPEPAPLALCAAGLVALALAAAAPRSRRTARP
jgi:hypothetical protein